MARGKREVCSIQPVHVCHNASFLVDLHSLADAMDIRADENGVWDCKGSPVTCVSIHKNGSTTTVHKRSKLGSHAHHYKVTRVYHAHKLCPMKADATFTGKKHVVPPELRGKLNGYQRLYLATCLEVPAEALGVE